MSSKKGTVYINDPASDNLVDDQGKETTQQKELSQLAKSAKIIIFECESQSSIFRFQKSKLTISPNRVTITTRGFLTRDEFPMPLENITNARVFTHLGRATLTIETFGILKPDAIKNLKVDEARLARRYVLALIECKKEGIDLKGMDLAELKKKLKEIGVVQYSTDDEDYHEL